MSYILEAIKRSDRQRLLSGAGASRTVTTLGEATKRPPLLLYGAAAAVLVAAGMEIGRLQPWQDARAPSAVAIVAPEEPAALSLPAAAPLAEPVEELHVMPVQPYRPPGHAREEARIAPPPAQASVPATPPGPPLAMPAAAPQAAMGVTTPVSPPANTARTPGDAPAAVTGQAAMPDLAAPGVAPARAAANADGAAAAPSAGAAIHALYELPPQVLRDMPAMTISGFIYSDAPSGRMVYINDHPVQEGQYVADGLKLEQITPDSLIFSFRNYRFRRYLR